MYHPPWRCIMPEYGSNCVQINELFDQNHFIMAYNYSPLHPGIWYTCITILGVLVKQNSFSLGHACLRCHTNGFFPQYETVVLKIDP